MIYIYILSILSLLSLLSCPLAISPLLGSLPLSPPPLSSQSRKTCQKGKVAVWNCNTCAFFHDTSCDTSATSAACILRLAFIFTAHRRSARGQTEAGSRRRIGVAASPSAGTSQFLNSPAHPKTRYRTCCLATNGMSWRRPSGDRRCFPAR